MSGWEEPFIAQLEEVRNNRGVLAALKRNIGKKYPDFKSGWLVYAGVPNWATDDTKTVAELFALHPQAGGKANLGHSVGELARKTEQAGGSRESVERRFAGLIDADKEDLPYHLRQMVSLLKSKEIPVNWLCLLKDISYWDFDDDKEVQNRWAKGFWLEDK